jgi:hypothetical protein
MKKDRHYDVIVIGGGASGLMAAGRAGELGKRVLILEKNERLGEKLKITGGGRCNVTNAEYDIHKLLAHYGKAKDFLFSPFSQFGVKDTFSFFEERGLPLVVEARNRAFPHTQKAHDVFRVMEKYAFASENVFIQAMSPVTAAVMEDGRITKVMTKTGQYSADSYIFAVGGLSAPFTGSTGDGFRWLTKLGHTVNEPSPNVVPLKISDEWVHSLSGVSLSFMKITFSLNGKKSFSKTGKILFTHFGLSGPLILNSASEVADLLKGGDVTCAIDMYPDTDLGSVEKQILKTFEENKNKAFKNVLPFVCPKGMAPGVALFLPEEILETKVHSVSKEDRKMLANLFKALPAHVDGLMGFDRAVISDGGLPLDEVDTRTMKSKKVSNLYITGDLLHINRPSGGFSLQLCWTTGFVAGTAVAKK